ncbi:MAG: phage tail protein, partial [Caldilinea sp.]
MSTPTRERLYELLPAIYRIRDAENGEPLHALLAIMGDELARIEDDITGLYDDWFIETCAEWVVPYIGDLLGVRGLHQLTEVDGFSQRAFVANTLRYRRRKGTAPVLEQLARDVTGWPCRVVEFFERLATTQHLNHVRLYSPATADLRQAANLELVGSALESVSHTGEVRNIVPRRGRYNIPNMGLFLWRVQPYFVQGVTPQPAVDPPDGRYRFSPLGNDIPLFNRPRTETEIVHLAEEPDLPVPMRRRALYDDLEALRLGSVTGEATTSH